MLSVQPLLTMGVSDLPLLAPHQLRRGAPGLAALDCISDVTLVLRLQLLDTSPRCGIGAVSGKASASGSCQGRQRQGAENKARKLHLGGGGECRCNEWTSSLQS